jgi:hypothetical protein
MKRNKPLLQALAAAALQLVKQQWTELVNLMSFVLFVGKQTQFCVHRGAKTQPLLQAYAAAATAMPLKMKLLLDSNCCSCCR